MSKLAETTSSQTLFTFTPELAFLVDMLKSGIKARYSFESLPYGNRHYSAPMKCFCDIPLSKAKKHMDWFGDYGLGIKKGYLMGFGVTPVLYVHKQSSKDFLKTFTIGNERSKVIGLMKSYKGNVYREDEGIIKRFMRSFYDEREWRYIPKDGHITVLKNGSIKKGWLEHKDRNMQEPYLGNTIPLEPDAIEYIIVKNKTDIGPLRVALRELYKDRDTFEFSLTKIVLSTKIKSGLAI